MLPLDDLLVLDFSTLLPGPLASLFLSEAGARVIIDPESPTLFRFENHPWPPNRAQLP